VVQLDGTQTLSIHMYNSTFPRIPVWSYGTVGWDRHYGLSIHMYRAPISGRTSDNFRSNFLFV
jgi:hypothetical protein